MDEKPIRLKFTETVTNKLDGTQATTASLVDSETGRAVADFIGATTDLSANGRVLSVRVNVFDHEVLTKTEVVQTVKSGGAPSDQ